MSDVKFMLHLTADLRIKIKREARKQGISMNEFIVTVLSQFIEIQKGYRNGKRNKETIGADTRETNT